MLMLNKLQSIYSRFSTKLLMMVAVLALASAISFQARAAELSDVVLPDTFVVADSPLLLNGIGVREYGLFGTDVYVAGLYLTVKQTDANAILQSSGPKAILLEYRYGGGDTEDAQKAWQDFLQKNCQSMSCDYPQSAVDQFMAMQRAVKEGDKEKYIFSNGGVEVFVNSLSKGRIENAEFAKVLLACWIGPNPTTEDLKNQLLGLSD